MRYVNIIIYLLKIYLVYSVLFTIIHEIDVKAHIAVITNHCLASCWLCFVIFSLVFQFLTDSVFVWLVINTCYGKKADKPLLTLRNTTVLASTLEG